MPAAPVERQKREGGTKVDSGRSHRPNTSSKDRSLRQYPSPWGALADAYDDYLLPDVARVCIGHVRQDFYGCLFYGIVLNDDNAEFQSVYIANGAMVAATVGPRTKALEGLSEGNAQRTMDS